MQSRGRECFSSVFSLILDRKQVLVPTDMGWLRWAVGVDYSAPGYVELGLSSRAAMRCVSPNTEKQTAFSV